MSYTFPTRRTIQNFLISSNQVRPSNGRFPTLNRTWMVTKYDISDWMFTTSLYFFSFLKPFKNGSYFSFSAFSMLGMFMKILNFCVFNKMESDRKILWFPSKWGVNHLKRWRNGEVVGKKRIMNYSQKLWPGTANWLVYYSMCQGPFFHHKGAFNKNALLFHEIWLLLAEIYCPKV